MWSLIKWKKIVPHSLLIVNIDDNKYVHVYLACRTYRYSYLYRTNKQMMLHILTNITPKVQNSLHVTWKF